MATRCLSSMVLRKVPVNSMDFHSLPLTPNNAQAYPQSVPRQHDLFSCRSRAAGQRGQTCGKTAVEGR